MKQLPYILKVFFVSGAVTLVGVTVFQVSYIKGHNDATQKAQEEFDNLLTQFQNGQIAIKPTNSATPVSTSRPIATKAPAPKPVAWGGPDLWTAVNKRRVELGVNQLSQRDEICTIASIRLNQLLELGRLDGHEGFSTLPEKRPDLKWIYEKYTLTEFLVQGASSAQDAVNLWENTLGHKKLLTGGEYVWGCIYAQNSYGVAITAY